MTFQDSAGPSGPALGAFGAGDPSMMGGMEFGQDDQDQPQDDDQGQPEQQQPGDQQAQPDQKQHEQFLRWIDMPNIADELSDDKLGEIGQRVKREYDIDNQSRADWVKKTKAALDLAMQVAPDKSYPWPKAANVIFPMMTTSAMQFAARAYPAIVMGKDVAKGIVIGDDDGVPQMNPQSGQPMQGPNGQPQWQIPPGAKRARAEKVGEHMSWQLLEEMEEWEGDTDRLLHMLPIMGCAFKKSYFDPTKGRNVSLLISALNVVINYKAKSVELAPRVTEELELYPLECLELELAGLFRKIEYTASPNTDGDEDAPRKFLEQHRWLDLDEDDYPEPYIVTVHEETSQVVRVRARYDSDGLMFDGKTHKLKKIDPVQYYTKYNFLENPDDGIYGLGFGQLLRPINEAVNTSLNQILDAGHLQITGGGFIGKSLSMHTGAVRFSPGEYKMINVAGGAIKDNIVPLNFPGPSTVLFQVLGLMIEAGKDIAAVKDVLTGEQNQHNVPATTTMALIEQGLKVFTAIYKRIHRALKQELAKLYRLNAIYLPEHGTYKHGDQWKSISRQDYLASSGVEPISDPTMVSDTQRLGKAQFLMQFAQDPMMNGLEIRRRILDAAQIEHTEALLVPNPPPNPTLLAKASELQIKAQREKAAELKDMAQAILFFAQADAVVGDMHLGWVQAQLDTYKAHFEAASATVPGGEGQGDQPHPMAPPGPMGGFQAPPGPGDHPFAGPAQPSQGPMAGPPGQLQPPPGGLERPPGPSSPPPVPGARRAPDGHWYVPDPKRKGKFLMLIPHARA